MKTDFKVLMTLMDLTIGGGQTHVVELCRELAQKGVRVFVASNGGIYEKELASYGIKHFKAPLHNKNPKNILVSYYLLKRIIRKNDIHLVHAHARIPAFVCGLLHKKMNFRFATTAHGVYSMLLPFKLLSNWGEQAFAVSDDIRNYLIDNYKYNPRNIFVTINGIDLERFSAETDCSSALKDLKLYDNKKRIISVSRLDKDISLAAHMLIECAEYLFTLNRKLEIVIVGAGDDYANVRERAEAVNAKLKKKLIHVVGGRTDVNALLASADIVIAISRAALEAMATEKPVIMAGHSGYGGIFTSEILDVSIDTNFCFRGCEDMTVRKLQDDILKLLRSDESDLKELGRYGREVVKEYYSSGRMADDALLVYERLLKRNNETDIVISGFYGSGNHGDESVLRAIISDLRAISPGIKITVLSRKPKDTAITYGVRSIYRFNYPMVLRELKRSTLLISGGGSLIQDVTSSRSLWHYLFVIRSAVKRHTRVMLYANGIGPVNRPKNIKKVARALNEVDVITLRDEESLAMLEEMGVSTDKTVVTADPAFALENVDNDKTSILLRNLRLTSRKYFCVSVRSWKSSEKNLNSDILNFCSYIYGKYRYTALFVPMQPVDAAISKSLAGQMKQAGMYAGDNLSIDAVQGLISGAEFTLGMRLHSLVYSIKAGVPAIGLVYDPKVASMLKQFGQGYYCHVEDVNLDALKGYADFCIVNREIVSKGLEEMSAQARQKAKENAKIAIELWDSDCF